MIIFSSSLAKRLNSSIYACITLLCAPLNAGTIDWGTALGGSHLRSDQVSAVDSAYVFYLGYFASGFTPTADNTADWSSHWTTVDAANYQTRFRAFASRHRVGDNDPTPGTQAYIWGVRRDSDDMEWILVTNANWHWPNGSSQAKKRNWIMGDTATAILGSINNGQGFATTSVDSPAVPVIGYDLWAKRFFADSDARALPEADANNNGVPNLIEYALDRHPDQGGQGELYSVGRYALPADPGGDQRYLGVIIQPSLDADVTITGQVSSTLDFSANVSPAIIETLEDGTLLIRDSQPLNSANPRKFIRLEFN